ncbi:MAG: ABC transporter permease, partial [Bifidobacteriaceae bacterium]|nr:ABC transporter permease [Bifidobacteriaceae bacterium]
MSQPSARSSEATELVEAGLAGVDDPVGPKLGSPRDATGPTPPGLEPGGGSVADQPVPASRGGGRHSGLIRYIIRRLIIAVILVFGLTLVTFCLTNLVPGDPVAAALGQRAADNPATVAQFKAEYGLDKPLPEQYLTYLVKLLHGDLGQSAQTHRAITQDLAQAVPATAEIALGAIVASAIIGICFGAWSAYKRGKITDQVL